MLQVDWKTYVPIWGPDPDPDKEIEDLREKVAKAEKLQRRLRELIGGLWM